MKNLKTLINFDASMKETLPHYYDVAFIQNKIKEALFAHTGKYLSVFSYSEDMDELLEIMQETMFNNPNEATLVAYVFDGLEKGRIRYSTLHLDEPFIEEPIINNALYYFPAFEVAVTKLPVYQSHEDYEEILLFAEDSNSIISLLHHLYKKRRESMKGFINLFIATDHGIQRSKEVFSHQVNREDVLLEEKMKKEIFRSIDEFFIHEGAFFKKHNLPYKRGILLYGAPGNGKTTLVKSIAGTTPAPVVYWQITEFTYSYIIKEIFSTVSKIAPVILVIEDIDSMPEDARSVFLNTLDGASSKEGIFIIGTTNYPEKIDPALINRAGRFDRAYEIQLPDKIRRFHYLQGKNLTEFISDEELNDLAEKTQGLSIAQLNELHVMIALQWHYDNTVDLQAIIKELQTNNKRTWRQDWQENPLNSTIGFGN
jgi:SpoVK/Ycf46/Vps4 family AAA+-type ATPase